jgi:hypothetical protein
VPEPGFPPFFPIGPSFAKNTLILHRNKANFGSDNFISKNPISAAKLDSVTGPRKTGPCNRKLQNTQSRKIKNGTSNKQ